MQKQVWQVHIDGGIFGPFSTDDLAVLLRNGRVHFSDFAWAEGMRKWQRIFEIDEFKKELPPTPDILPVMGLGSESSKSVPRERESRRESPAPTPVAPAKREPKKEAPAEVPEREPALVATPAVAKLGAHSDQVKIEAKVESKEYGSFEVQDISEGGVFVKTKKKIAIGTEFSFKLASEDLGKTLEMTGVVIRHSDEKSDQQGFALQFIRVNPAHKRAIQGYVDKQRGLR